MRPNASIQVIMSEATLAFPDQNEIRTLFGARDEYLRKVREALGIDVVLRGDELRLKGDDEHVRRGLEVFQKLRRIFEESGQITDADVGQILQAYGGNGVVPAEAIDVFAASRKVHPRTEGQAEYVRAMDQNDLVFCIGPAGCGKTYLAVAKAVNALRTEQARKIVLVRPAVEAGKSWAFCRGTFSPRSILTCDPCSTRCMTSSITTRSSDTWSGTSSRLRRWPSCAAAL